MISLKGKNIFITGASSGIGRECAIKAAQLGAQVVLLARNQERLKQTLDSLAGDHHRLSLKKGNVSKAKVFN